MHREREEREVRRTCEKSVHIIIVVLNLGKCSLAECISSLPIKNLVNPVIFFSENAEFQLLLLLLHLVLTLQQKLGDLGERLLDSQFAEIGLFDFVTGKLTATTCSTAVVLVACACWLDHPEGWAFHDIMTG